jgi:hypothetical protein
MPVSIEQNSGQINILQKNISLITKSSNIIWRTSAPPNVTPAKSREA